MRLALLLGSLLLLLACGDDDPAPDGGGAGSGGDGEGIAWLCTCWTENASGQRSEEDFMRCSATDPTERLTGQHRSAVQDAGFTGDCEPCEETDETCTLED